MSHFFDTFGSGIGIVLGMSTIVIQIGRGLRKASKFYRSVETVTHQLASIDEKLTRHLEGHA